MISLIVNTDVSLAITAPDTVSGTSTLTITSTYVAAFTNTDTITFSPQTGSISSFFKNGITTCTTVN